MKNLLKKSLVVIMVVVMTLTAAPLAGLDSLFIPEAQAKTISEYAVGDIIEFGSYPQSKVEDEVLISKLNTISLDWVSYRYYSGTGSWHDGKMVPGDFMKYADVEYKGIKYRAVKITGYRPGQTGGLTDADSSSQDERGYLVNQTYWFIYEPIKWKVLDPSQGLVMSDIILDAQAFNNTVYYDGVNFFSDINRISSPNNYDTSSVKEWLNSSFINISLDENEHKLLNSEVFLISSEEARNRDYGFNPSRYDSTLQAKYSDYSVCQGLPSAGNGYATWYFRSRGQAACHATFVNEHGYIYGFNNVNSVLGIRPLLKLNINIEIPEKINFIYTQTHTVSKYKTKNEEHTTKYFANAAEPMDGSNGNPDLCIPGLSLGENMVPQGVAYYKAKNQLLISSYYRDAKTNGTPCYIFALDMDTGKMVGEYKIKEPDGTDLSAHVGGIAVSDYNLYITGNDADICKVSLSQLTGKSGEIKIEDKCSVSDWLGDANTAYLSIDDGTLVTGNFYYSKNSDYNTPAKAAKSVIITHSLSGNSAEEEWNNLCSFSRLSVVKVPDSVDRIQGIAYRDGKFYISSSFGRKNTSTLYIADWSGNTLKNISDYTALPMMEEITFVGDYIYAVFESGSAFYFEGLDGGGKSKDPTDVLWKIDYKELIDIYNLGDETYNFENFSDADSDGHCFGMSMTSAGYHTRKLDISTIGGNRRNGLYVLSGTSTVKEPICYYQDIQAKYSKNAIVAGGSSYTSWFGFSDIDSDWKEVINYVKNHKYDNKGTLQIGYRKNGEGGHAINFLRYEVVDGQERIYAYDNNFPDTEVYFYKNSSGDIVQAPFATFSGAIDCIALRSVEKYFNSVGDYNATRYIYADKDDISIPGAEVYYVDCGTVSRERVVFEIPEGEEKVTIIPLVENAEFEYLDVYYSFENAENGKVGEFVLAEDENSAGNSVSLTFIEYPWEIDITTPSVSTINYGDTLVLYAELAETALPEGYSILWTVEGTGVDLRQSTDGLTCEVTSVQNGNVTVKATIVDENGEALIDTEGNEISAEQNLNSKVNFWQKIVSFFKNLFRISRIILQSK